MAIKDLSGVIALVGVVFTAGVVFTTMRSDISELKKNGGVVFTTLPKGAIVSFNLEKCPEGWDNVQKTEGRYLVGIPEGAEPGSMVGNALKLGENRATGLHSHDFDGARRQDHNRGTGPEDRARPTGETRTTETAGVVEGTNAPYLQVLFCEKQ